MTRVVKLEIDGKVTGLVNSLKTGQKALEDMAAGAKKFSPEMSASMAKSRSAFLDTGKAAHRAAGQYGLLYDSSGKLTDQFGRNVSSATAAKLGLKEVSDEARFASESADRMSDSLQTVGAGLTTFGVLAAGGATLAVKKFADFDKQMSSVQAATHETETNMGLLRQSAIDAGADTAFSAVEAAQGIEELAKAGVETRDIMGGGLTGALDLAAAGNLGVGESAEIAATAMTQFKLSGDQIPHLADLLAAGAGKAQGSVADLGAALNQSGLVASATGLSIEETTGTLAAFASAGLIGSDAGTSFKSMLQRLQNPSKQSAQVMEELGINMYDANGEFAGMDVLAGQLSASLAGKSAAERDAAMATMFGADAVRAANVLYEQGAQGITDWTNKVNDAGYASQTASIMQNNLAGDIEKLGGAFDTVFIKSGGVGNDMLRGLVQTAESFIDVVGKIPAPVLGIGTVIGGMAGGAALLGGGLITVLPKIRDTRDAMNDLFPAGSRGAKGLGKVRSGMADLAKGAAVAGGILAVGVGLGKLAELSYTGNIIEGTGHVAVGLQEIIDKGPRAEGVLDEIFKGRDGTGLTDSIKGVDDAIDTVFGDSAGEKFNRWGENIVNSMTGIKGSVKIAEEAFGGIDAELANLVNGGNADGAAKAMDAIQQKLRDSGVSAEDAASLFPQYADALNRIEAESGGATEGTDILAGALGEVGGEAEEAAASLDDIIASLFELGVLTRDVRAAESEFQASIDGVTESIKTNGTSLDVNTEKGRANRDAFDGLAASGQAYTESLAQSGASEKELQASMQGTYDSLITAAGQFGITGEKADALAREIIGIPPGVDIETWMSDAASQMALTTAENIAAIPGYTKVTVAVSEDGTVGQVQSKINSVTGKTEYVFVTDDGTSSRVQQGIVNINGVERTVWVDDNGTVYGTQGEINGIKGKDVTITAEAATNGAESDLNHTARPRVSHITQKVSLQRTITESIRQIDNGPITSQFGRYQGGKLPSRANGGRLPYTGLGRDMILGVGSDGRPVANVDDGEWIIRESSADKFNGVLDAINRDSPSVQHLSGFDGGGQLSVPPSYEVRSHATARNVSASVDTGAIAQAVASAIASYQPVVNIDGRKFYGAMVGAERQYGSRR